MHIGIFAAGLALAACANAAFAQGKEWKAQVLIIGSVEELTAWIEKQPAERGGDAGRLRQIPAGKKVFFPIVASEVQAPAGGEMRLTADIAFFAPDGKMIWEKKRCCTATIANRPDVRTVSLGPAADMTLESGDAQGLYTVRATITDGQRASTATETFSYVRPAASPSTPAASPRAPASSPRVPMLNQREPAPRPARADTDKRDCLSLPTPAEVIRCAEKK